MFGSDGGVRHPREGVQAIRDADFLTEEQRRAILHDTAARFLRLEE
jgi:predicted TIM-barrel fold metal-dependent hydrolase